MFDSAAEEPAHKNKKEEALPTSLFSLLPDAVVLTCLARLSKFDYAALNVVSNSFRSLVVSPELYKLRTLIGNTEKYLYVCLRTPPPGPVSARWFIYRIDAAKRTSNRLVQITSSPWQPSETSVVALEWGIYVIGGKLNGKPSSDVFLLDCRSHNWRQVSSMAVARASAVAGVVDGKIYVYGGCVVETDSWGEVYDPKTQRWDSLPMPIPNWHLSHHLILGSVVMEKKVYSLDEYNNIFYYSPTEGKWGKGIGDSNLQETKCCVIDELLYCCDTIGNLFWCEAEELKGMAWRPVKGLEALKKMVLFDGDVGELSASCMSDNGVSRLSSFGRNIVMFWDAVLVGLDDDSLQICCAEISLERRHEGEIWGNIEWSDAIMTTDPLLYSSQVLHSVSVNV